MSRVSPARAPSMGFLRSIESGIERVVDGTVGRVVRVSVQPVEIARKLAKELEDGKVQSGGRTIVPSQYTVYLHRRTASGSPSTRRPSGSSWAPTSPSTCGERATASSPGLA